MEKKKITIITIVIFVVGLIITGASYAFWSWTSNVNKNVVFNTASNLKNYIVYNEGESAFTGELNVSNSYQTGSIHSTISIYKTTNVNLLATIHMDVNRIGPNMRLSRALKWVVTEGNSSNPGTVLAQGNFVGTNNGDTLTLVPDINVNTTETFYTIWIWLDSSENPSDNLSGETLDTNVWTEINQAEGLEDRYEITNTNANYQQISATVVDSKYKVTKYAVTQTNTEPSSWTTITPATDQKNVYTLNTSVESSGTYYVWFKDENDRVTSKQIVVSNADTSAPNCSWGTFSQTGISTNMSSTIILTCTDADSKISVHNLQTSDITASSDAITITSITKESITNGYKYTVIVIGTSNYNTANLTLPANKIRNGINLGNANTVSGNITVSAANYINTTTNNYYGTLNDAFADVNSNQTIQVLNSVTEASTATLADTKTGIKLDLNGKTVDMGTYYISNSGELDIYNSSTTEAILEGSNTNPRQGVVYNNGILTTNATSNSNPLTIRNKSSDEYARVIHNNVGKNVTLNDNTLITFTTLLNRYSSRYIITTSGILTIDGATIINTFSSKKSYNYGIGITDAAGKVIMLSGTITTDTNSIYNSTGVDNASPVISISGGTINSTNGTAISNSGSSNISTVLVTGGTINALYCGIVLSNSNRVLTLGTDDGGTPSVDSPTINGTICVQQSTAKFNFYDGKITSTSGNTLAGYADEVVNTPNGYVINKSVTDGIETAILGPPNYENITKNEIYGSLNVAFTKVSSGDTIRVLRDTIEISNATLADSKTGVKLDLNGKTINMSDYYIKNDGELDIYNSSSTPATLEGNGADYARRIIYNNGTLTTNATSVSNQLTIKNNINTPNGRVIVNNTGKTVTLNANTLITFTTALNSDGERYLISTLGALNIDGAVLNNTITGSTYDRGIIINDASGRVVISSGMITTYGDAIYNNSGTGTDTPAISISGGTITSTGNTAIYNYAAGNIEITGGIITGRQHGIYNRTTGMVTLGVNDSGIPNTSSPVINSTATSVSYYGICIYNASGTFNFYDGKVTSNSGTGYALNSTADSVVNTPSGYVVRKSSTGGVETAILAKISTVTANATGGAISATTGWTVASDNLTATKQVIENNTYGTLPSPNKTGYTFDGWYTDETGGTEVTASTSVTEVTNHTIYAHWSANQYYVAYNKNTTDTVSNMPSASTAYTYAASGNVALSSNAPTRTGYDFLGWSTSQTATSASYSAGGSWAKNNVPNSGNTFTLYAVWKAQSIQCTAGKYLRASDASCQTCPANSYCTGGTWTYDGNNKGIATCTSLGSAYTTSAAGATANTSCYIPKANLSGKYVATAKAAPVTCAAGGYCPGTTDVHYNSTGGRTECAAGKYNADTGSSASSACTNCTAGYYCTKGSTSATQHACEANYYCPAGSGSQTACTSLGSAYTTSAAKSTKAANCYIPKANLSGKYVATANAAPVTCAAGGYCPGTTDVHYGSTGGRTECAAGKYNADTGSSASSACTNCTAGYYCTKGSTSATQHACEANYYCPAGSGSQTACTSLGSAYTTSAAKSTKAANCYIPKANLSGKYVATANAAPVTCAAGGYCPGTTDVHYGSTGGRTECAAGKYNADTGSSASSACTNCTAGYYCTKGSTSATQHACEANYYCPAGSGSQTACTSLGSAYTTSAAKSTKSANCYIPKASLSGKYVATANAAPVTCAAGGYCPGTTDVYYGSTGGRTECNAGTYNGSNGSSASSACASC